MTIVAAIDRSERGPAVVTKANELAGAFDEDLHVVHVLGQGEFISLERTSVDDTGQPVPMDEIRRVASDIAAEAIEQAGADAEPVGLVGDAADEVLRYADERSARYIVLGGRRRSPVGKAVFGSVTQKVLLRGERPVVTIIDGEGE